MTQELGLGDIYGTWYIPLLQRTWVRYTLCGIGIAGIILLCIWLIRWVLYRRALSARAPWKVALKGLRELEHGSYTTQEQIKLFYARLIDILRIYLSARYALVIVSKTEDELRVWLRQVDYVSEFTPAVDAILRESSLVRFALIQPEVTLLSQHVAIIKSLVMHTIPHKKKSSDKFDNTV